MKSLLEFFFFISIFLIIYNYFLYPVAINFLVYFREDPHLKKVNLDGVPPSVTFVVAAFNEEKVIAQKIENTLALDYPKDKLQIIVVSDGSDDSTAEIVQGYSNDGVLSMHIPERQGKSAALNRALDKSEGDIILFSDANNDFSKQSVKELVKHFTDPEIGAVTGAKHIYQSGQRESATGDGLYWKYEAFIKKAESSLGSITAAEGEIFAVRRDLMKPIDPKNINDDAAITFDIVKSGYRVLYEENARSEEEASIDMRDDINVKVRMTAGGYQTIKNECAFLFPPLSWFAFTFFSHKILRWLTPHFMLIAFFSNLFLLRDGSYFYLFILQFSFYTISIYGWFNRKQSKLPNYIYLPMYFTVMNIALFMGFIRFIKGKQGVAWKKAQR